jgi:hypothetical protein
MLRQAFASCPKLPWHADPGSISGVRLSERCTVTETGQLPPAAGTARPWALYRRETVWGPGPDTPVEDLDLFPDTVAVDELVLFAGTTRSRLVRPVWHDRAETRYEFLRPPRARGLILVHRRCANGTGGCMDFPYLFLPLPGATVTPLHPRYLSQIRDRLPEEWGTNKGIWIDPERRVAEAGVALPGDANCCPSLRLEASLKLDGDSLRTDSISLLPDSASNTWHVLPGERFGPVGPDVSEEALRTRLGSWAVRPAEIYLAEGFCTPGTRLFPGEPYEVRVAWADSARTRPAFVRAGLPGTGWRTPLGVRVGTTLAELEELADTVLTFGGLGWDYGGGMSWPEHRGALGLVLAIDPSSEPTLDETARTDPRVDEIFGDRAVRSDHPVIRQLTLHVTDMGLGWAAPFQETECEGMGPP